MATIAKIAVGLTANTGQFSAGMKKSTKHLNTFQKSARGASSALASIKNIAGGVMIGNLLSHGIMAATRGIMSAARGMTNLAKNSMQVVDGLAKQSDRLGMATEDLHRYRYMADLAGVSNESLFKGLEKMGRNVAEAARGMIEPSDALKTLNLDARELAAMNPSEQFMRISEAVKNLAGSGERARVVFKLFGRGGGELLPVMYMGAQGMADMADEADRIQGIITRFDAAKVEKANDNISRMKYAIRSVANSIAIELSPIISSITDEFLKVSQSSGDMGGIVSSQFDRIGSAVHDLVVVIETLGRAMDLIKIGGAAVFGGLAATIQGVASVGAKALDMMVPDALEKKMGVAFNGFAKNRWEDANLIAGSTKNYVGSKWDSLSKGAINAGDTADAFQKKFDEMIANAEAKAKSTAEDAAARNVNDAGAAAMEELFEDAEKFLASIETPMDKYTSALDDINRMLDAGVISQDEYARGLAKITDELHKTDDIYQEAQQINKMDAMLDPQSEYIDQISRLNEMLNRGLITQETYFRAVNKAQEDLTASIGEQESAYEDLYSTIGQGADARGLAPSPGSITGGGAAAQSNPFAQAAFRPITTATIQGVPQVGGLGNSSLGGQTLVRDPQLETTNDLLRQMLRSKTGAVAV